MSVLCWEQFLISCSLDKMVKVGFVLSLVAFVFKHMYKLYRTKSLLPWFVLVSVGVDCYREWKFGSDIYSQ